MWPGADTAADTPPQGAAWGSGEAGMPAVSIQVNIGLITCPLADIAALEGSYDVVNELDQ